MGLDGLNDFVGFWLPGWSLVAWYGPWAWCELGKDVIRLQTQVGLHATSELPLLSVRIGEPWWG